MDISFNITLIAVLIILASMAIKGYRNGLIQEILSVAALGVAIIALALIASAIGNYLSDKFGDMLIAIVFFVILMLVTNISKLIVMPVRFLSRLPVLNWVNKITGLAAGLLKGILCVWVIFIVVDKFSFLKIFQYFILNIESNAFLAFLHQNNYIANFF